jgi:acetyltransferase-like isoleucine patch superfamily enzyme
MIKNMMHKSFIVFFTKILISCFLNLRSDFLFFRKTHGQIPRFGIALGLDNMSFGRGSTVGDGYRFYAQTEDSRIVIYDNVSINYNVSINADFGTIEIGSNSLIGPAVIMRSSNHSFSDSSSLISSQGHDSGNITIGENVWIGANATILPNVSIGSNSIIGAGSVVTKNIPNDVIAVGVPAKVIKSRNN